MTEEYKIFKWRWGVFATVALTNITTFTNTTGYFSVAAAAAEYFDADDAKMDLFALLGKIFLAPGLFIALFTVNKFGLKVSSKIS